MVPEIPSYVRFLRKRLNFGKRVQALGERLMERGRNIEQTGSRNIRCHARATLRSIRLKHHRPAFRKWEGDDLTITTTLDLSGIVRDLDSIARRML